MIRYQLAVFDNRALVEKQTLELPHYPAARLEAVQRACRILEDNALAIAIGEDWRIEVTDDRGLILFQFAFVTNESPYARRHEPHDAFDDAVCRLAP